MRYIELGDTGIVIVIGRASKPPGRCIAECYMGIMDERSRTEGISAAVSITTENPLPGLPTICRAVDSDLLAYK